MVPSTFPNGRALRQTDHRYRPEIDGLRAIAVIAVVLFHAGLAFPGGFVGVDVFFVISGFLVTGIIVRAIDAGNFSIGDFYCRRIRRIFPAAAVVTAAILISGYRSTFPGAFVQLSKASVAQSVFASNVFFWFDSGYFSRDVLTKPFLHFWSLAVEEQFYLAFPAVLSFLYWVGPARRRVVLGVVAIAVVSFAMSLYGTLMHPSATFYLLPTRAWELMVGAFVALTSFTIVNRKRAEWSALLGIILIAVAVFGLSEESFFPGLVALLPVAGTAMVIIANTTVQTAVGKLLSQRWIVFVGLISYSLYLWHWPLLALIRYLVLDPSTTVLVLAMITSAVIASISWRWIEQPIRRRQFLASNRSLLWASGIAWLALLVFPLLVIKRNGMPSRFDASQQVLIKDANWNGNHSSREIDQVERDDVPRFGKFPTGNDAGGFLLWGDSHAMTWTDVLEQAASAANRHGFATLHGGTPPIPGLWRTGMPNCREFNAAVLELINRKQIADVFLVSRWSVYVEGYSDADPKTDGRNDRDLFLSDGGESSQSGDESLAAMQRQIVHLASEMKRMQVRLWLIRQAPVQQTVIAEAAARNMLIGWDVNPIRATTLAKHSEQQSPIEPFYQIARPILEDTGGGLINLDGLFFDDQGDGIIKSGGRYFFKDDDHLSHSGALMLKPFLKTLLQDKTLTIVGR